MDEIKKKAKTNRGHCHLSKEIHNLGLICQNNCLNKQLVMFTEHFVSNSALVISIYSLFKHNINVVFNLTQ